MRLAVVAGDAAGGCPFLGLNVFQICFKSARAELVVEKFEKDVASRGESEVSINSAHSLQTTRCVRKLLFLDDSYFHSQCH